MTAEEKLRELPTDEEIARALDISRATVKRWRNGESAPSASMMPFVINAIANLVIERIKNENRV